MSAWSSWKTACWAKSVSNASMRIFEPAVADGRHGPCEWYYEDSFRARFSGQLLGGGLPVNTLAGARLVTGRRKPVHLRQQRCHYPDRPHWGPGLCVPDRNERPDSHFDILHWQPDLAPRRSAPANCWTVRPERSSAERAARASCFGPTRAIEWRRAFREHARRVTRPPIPLQTPLVGGLRSRTPITLARAWPHGGGE
jgi:hypothetical protein